MVFNGFKLWQFDKNMPIYSSMIYDQVDGLLLRLPGLSFFNNTWGKERGHSGHSTSITLWQTLYSNYHEIQELVKT